MKELIDAIKAKKWKVVIGIVIAGLAYYYGIPL